MIFAQKNCEVTYISNEGFLFEIEGKKVLIDALFDEIKENWCDSPSDSIIDLMTNSKHISERFLDTVKLFDIQNDNKGMDYFIPEEEVVRRHSQAV